MLVFKPIEINDQEKYNKYISLYSFKTCDYSFNALFAWREYYEVEICFFEESLYVKVININDKTPLFYLPITTYNLNESITYLEEYCQKNNYQLVFTCLEPFQKEMLTLERPNMFIYENMINNADYLYLRDNLKNLNGKKLKNKRNFINQFKNEYLSKYTYEYLKPENTKEIIEFIDYWINQDNNIDKNVFDHEKKAICNLLKYQKELNITGGLIKINGELVAFCLGTKKNDMMITQFEKARYDINGCYQMINYLFANNNCQDVTYINREEDLGIPGIRKAKESYDPFELAYNYNAYLKNNTIIINATIEDLDEVKNLWYQAFGNDKFANWFFNNIYQKNNTRLYKLDNRVIAMGQVMNFILTNGQQINYLYALATDKWFRKQGIMKEFISNITNDKLTILIPENHDLLTFYESLGYQKSLIGLKNTYFKKNFSTSSLTYLTNADIPKIDYLYRQVYQNSILRTNEFYNTIFDEFNNNDGIVIGIYQDDILIAYAFIFIKQYYITELISINKETDLLLIQSILKEYNLNEITCLNRYEGTPVYYCYKGEIPDNLYVNLLYN